MTPTAGRSRAARTPRSRSAACTTANTPYRRRSGSRSACRGKPYSPATAPDRKSHSARRSPHTHIGTYDAGTVGLDGWTLDINHSYDPVDRVLYLGDGRNRSEDSTLYNTITAVADASDAVAIGPDGSVYIAHTQSNRVDRVSPNGIITAVAGNGDPGFSGDGGPATQASLLTKSGVRRPLTRLFRFGVGGEFGDEFLEVVAIPQRCEIRVGGQPGRASQPGHLRVAEQFHGRGGLRFVGGGQHGAGAGNRRPLLGVPRAWRIARGPWDSL